jgi:PST family polysaccharide transporter
MNEHIKKFLTNGALLMSAKAIQILMPLITLPLILSSLPITEYGKFSALFATSLLIGVFIQNGFLFFLPRKVSEIRNNEELSKLLLNVLFFQLMLSVPLSMSYALYVFLNEFDVNVGSAVAIYSFVVLQIITPFWFFQGLQKAGTVLILQFMSSSLMLIILLILRNELTIHKLSLSYFFTHFIVFITSLILTRSIRVGLYDQLSITYIRNILKVAKPEFYQQISPNLYNNGLVVFLSTQLDSQTFGILSVALRVIGALIGMITSLCLASYPIIVKMRAVLVPLNILVVLSGLLATFTLYLLSDPISVFLVPRNSEMASFYLKLLSFSPFLIAVSRSVGINFLNLIGKQKIAQNYVIYNSITFGCLGVVFILFNPIFGFIASIMLARLSLAMHGIFYYNKYR